MLKFLPVSLYNVPAVETWLSDQARRGWHAVGFFGRLMRFQRGERKETAYRLEPQFHRAAAPDRDMLDLYADAGWECVTPAARNGFYLWRATRPDAREVHTDPAAEDLAYAWLAEGQEEQFRLTCVWVFLILAMLLLALGTDRSVVTSIIGGGVLPDMPFILVVCTEEFLEGLGEFLTIRKLRGQLLSGVSISHTAAPYRLHRLVRLGLYAAVVTVLLSLVFFAVVKRPVYGMQEDAPVPPAVQLGVESPLDPAFGRHEEWPLLEKWQVAQSKRDAFGQELAGWNATVYRLRLPFLAGQVLRETAYSNITYDLEEAPVRLENTPFDEARYLRAEDGTQYLVARLDGWVLYYKANVPEDLRDHLDDFAAVLAAE